MNETEAGKSSDMAPLIHFTDIDDCNRQQLISLLTLADEIAASPDRLVNAHPGRLLVNLFYEASTRTRLSFEIAAKRLGMLVANISATGSSVEKGETLEDTFHTIQAMAPDCVVLRHPEPGTASRLAEIAQAGVHVVNAGDGIAAHPTQALADALTLRQQFKNPGEVSLLIAGDIRHSRVARSNIKLLTTLGIGEIRLCGPHALMLPVDELDAGDAPVTTFDSMNDACEGANAIMILRIQKERIGDINLPTTDEYHQQWGLKSEHLELAAPDCRVMHPGPMNRGVEIASEVASGPRSLINLQVRNGLHARMALLHYLLT
jgi:aspartate carbamoyltransferase catalytic subunit